MFFQMLATNTISPLISSPKRENSAMEKKLNNTNS